MIPGRCDGETRGNDSGALHWAGVLRFGDLSTHRKHHGCVHARIIRRDSHGVSLTLYPNVKLMEGDGHEKTARGRLGYRGDYETGVISVAKYR